MSTRNENLKKDVDEVHGSNVNTSAPGSQLQSEARADENRSGDGKSQCRGVFTDEDHPQLQDVSKFHENYEPTGDELSQQHRVRGRLYSIQSQQSEQSQQPVEESHHDPHNDGHLHRHELGRSHSHRSHDSDNLERGGEPVVHYNERGEPWTNLVQTIPDPLNNPTRTEPFVNPFHEEEARGSDQSHVVAYIRNIGPTIFPPHVVMNLAFGNDFVRRDDQMLGLIEKFVKEFHTTYPMKRNPVYNPSSSNTILSKFATSPDHEDHRQANDNKNCKSSGNNSINSPNNPSTNSDQKELDGKNISGNSSTGITSTTDYLTPDEAWAKVLEDDSAWRQEVRETVRAGKEKYLLHDSYISRAPTTWNTTTSSGAVNGRDFIGIPPSDAQHEDNATNTTGTKSQFDPCPNKGSNTNNSPRQDSSGHNSSGQQPVQPRRMLSYRPELVVGPWVVLTPVGTPDHYYRGTQVHQRPYCLPAPQLSVRCCPLVKYILANFVLLKNSKSLNSLGYCFACFRNRELLDRFRQLMIAKRLTGDSKKPVIVSFAKLRNLDEMKDSFGYYEYGADHDIMKHCFWFDHELAPYTQPGEVGYGLRKGFDAFLSRIRYIWSPQGQQEANEDRRHKGSFSGSFSSSDHHFRSEVGFVGDYVQRNSVERGARLVGRERGGKFGSDKGRYGFDDSHRGRYEYLSAPDHPDFGGKFGAYGKGQNANFNHGQLHNHQRSNLRHNKHKAMTITNQYSESHTSHGSTNASSSHDSYNNRQPNINQATPQMLNTTSTNARSLSRESSDTGSAPSRFSARSGCFGGNVSSDGLISSGGNDSGGMTNRNPQRGRPRGKFQQDEDLTWEECMNRQYGINQDSQSKMPVSNFHDNVNLANGNMQGMMQNNMQGNMAYNIHQNMQHTNNHSSSYGGSMNNNNGSNMMYSNDNMDRSRMQQMRMQNQRYPEEYRSDHRYYTGGEVFSTGLHGNLCDNRYDDRYGKRRVYHSDESDDDGRRLKAFSGSGGTNRNRNYGDGSNMNTGGGLSLISEGATYDWCSETQSQTWRSTEQGDSFTTTRGNRGGNSAKGSFQGSNVGSIVSLNHGGGNSPKSFNQHGNLNFNQHGYQEEQNMSYNQRQRYGGFSSGEHRQIMNDMVSSRGYNNSRGNTANTQDEIWQHGTVLERAIPSMLGIARRNYNGRSGRNSGASSGKESSEYSSNQRSEDGIPYNFGTSGTSTGLDSDMQRTKKFRNKQDRHCDYHQQQENDMNSSSTSKGAAGNNTHQQQDVNKGKIVGGKDLHDHDKLRNKKPSYDFKGLGDVERAIQGACSR